MSWASNRLEERIRTLKGKGVQLSSLGLTRIRVADHERSKVAHLVEFGKQRFCCVLQGVRGLPDMKFGKIRSLILVKREENKKLFQIQTHISSTKPLEFYTCTCMVLQLIV